MFETAETGNKLSKEKFAELVPQLRVDLINAQTELREADFSVLVLVMGNDGPGCEEVVDRLNEWMDARFLVTRVFEGLTDQERQRPRFWRYWNASPAEGDIAIFMGAWALNAIADLALGRIDGDAFDRRLDHIRHFEKMLADDGNLILKFWLHVPKHEYKKRLKKKDEWRTMSSDHRVYEHFEELMQIAERLVRETGDWILVESTDRQYRDYTVGSLIRDAITTRLDQAPAPPPVNLPVFAGTPPLDALDLTLALDKKEYKKRLKEAQARLRRVAYKAFKKNVPVVLAFEGSDAAGKGGVIRRITKALPARYYRIAPIAAPTDEEKAHHYLWRFWRHLPGAGSMLVFDRSWYGRVLVERVEGFATKEEWKRAYAEIVDFEDQLVEHGIAFCKFWLQIDQSEQLERFKARENTPYKKYKITDEDYRNREKWDEYAVAVNEMVARTSTAAAPWHLVPANSKRWARVQVLETVCDTIEARL